MYEKKFQLPIPLIGAKMTSISCYIYILFIQETTCKGLFICDSGYGDVHQLSHSIIILYYETNLILWGVMNVDILSFIEPHGKNHV